MFCKAIVRGLLAAAVMASAVAARAVTIDLVPVGNAGNAADTRYNSISVGAVAKAYAIGKYEITAGQYRDFLNAVAATDTYGVYSTAMGDPTGSLGCNIQRGGTPGSYTYSVPSDPVNGFWADRPVNWVSWGDAARFANWLHNNQPTGTQGLTTTEDGAYYLNGATSVSALMAVMRQADAKWWIPSEDEWYKAAYHDKTAGLAATYFDYPTKSNTAPINTLPDPGNHANFYDQFDTGNSKYTIGSPYYSTDVGAFGKSDSPYGTFDQGGNVLEWNETDVYGYRGWRGGYWGNNSNSLAASYRYIADPPTYEYYGIGFRVASLPEPGSLVMLAGIALTALLYWWRKHV